ncbi:universal stress protein [Paenibacillus agaridevorans]|uniref:universal stress protein n=1 Tax=Paenibacillus agaridevorans TaxID=171404 RepID=UPI001BE4247A|nr:universal stress protein [Paenibacillus agaridevorans]
MYKRILLAADGSKNSIRAAEEAAKIASLITDSIVEVLFVADLSKVKEEVLHSQNHEDLVVKRHEKLIPIAELFSSKNIAYDMKIITGDPGPAIVEYANQQTVDLVIIGNRGLNKFQEFVMGSVSHKVVKHVKCPVVVVK